MPQIFLSPLCSSTCEQKRSLGAEMMRLVCSHSAYPPKGHSFLTGFITLGRVWLWNLAKLHPHPKLSALWIQPARIHISIYFSPRPFPVYSSLVHLTFIDAAAVAPVQFISSQRAQSKYIRVDTSEDAFRGSLWDFPQVTPDYLW